MARPSHHKSKQISFSKGEGFNLGKAKNLSEPFFKFARQLERPLVTPEPRHEYLKMNDKRQAHLKGQNGWIMRAHVEKGNRRRDAIKPGDLIALDIDYAIPEYMERLLAGEIFPGTALAAHTTRSHTPESPRLRIFLATKTKLPADKYQAACRIVAQLGDPEMEFTDKVSARVAQMMYLPTCSADMEKHYVFYEQEGELLDWEAEVKRWEKKNGSANDIGNLPRFPGEHELREAAEKAEDPLEKDGLVGTFCRAYSITELVEGKDGEEPLLAEDYEGTEYHQGVITRMTYLKGSTSNGAVVYDDKFVYSHHGSDPAQDQLLNAYDLVRTHLFDAASDDPDAPMNAKASIKAMNKWMADLPSYQAQAVEERYDLDTMFEDDEDESWIEHEDDEDDDAYSELVGTVTAEARAEQDKAERDELSDLLGVPISSVVDTSPTRYQRQRASKPPKNWVATELELTEDGTIKSTLHNIATIITNDPRFYQKIAFDAFAKQIKLLSDIKTKSKTVPTVECTDKQNGMLWDDFHDITIRAVLEAPNGKKKPGYGLKVSDRDIVAGVKIAARNNSYHPVKEYLSDVGETWDGEDRIATFADRYLGTGQNAYTSEAFRMMMIASVARIFSPGCKFDYAAILEGGQGIGKSTMIKCLYGEEFFGEMDADLGDRRETSEQLAGKWALEMSELSALNKADHGHAKQFMRRQDDDVRGAYERNVTRHPRQCVVWGSTNESLYLRDPTGNRSYWVFKCSGDPIDLKGILREKDQLWAQAVVEHNLMRAKYPRGDLPLTLTGEALRIAEELQEGARQTEMWEDWTEDLVAWAKRPVRLSELAIEMGWDGYDMLEMEDDPLVVRVAFTQGTALGGMGLRDGAITNAVIQMNMGKVKARLAERGWQTDMTKTRNVRVAGKQDRNFITPWADEDSLKRGYAVTGEAEPPLDLGSTETNDGDSLI